MGAGGSSWFQRKVRRAVHAQVAKIAPPNVADVAVKKAKELRSRVASAVGEGRSAMSERESDLRARIGSAPKRLRR
jgi:ElaB/YqjD/DUF883 family membrane-anchored ribosome-binding protein